MTVSPMMQHFQQLRRDVDYLLAFQMGDFFEFYGNDARIVAEVCNIALSKRGDDKDGNPLPMCGFPASREFPGTGQGDVVAIGSCAPYFGAIV